MKMLKQSRYLFLMVLLNVNAAETMSNAGTVDNFIVQASDVKIRLRRIDWNALSDSDTSVLRLFVPNLYQLWNIHGFAAVAEHNKISLTPDLVINDLKTFFNNQRAKMPEGQKIQYHWIIEDLQKSNTMAALLRVDTCTEDRPVGYDGQQLLSIGLTIDSHYRGNGNLTRFMIPVLRVLAGFNDFSNATFCFTTSVKNKPINKIAKKLDSKEVSHYSKDRNFKKGKQQVELKTFVIPAGLYRNVTK